MQMQIDVTRKLKEIASGKGHYSVSAAPLLRFLVLSSFWRQFIDSYRWQLIILETLWRFYLNQMNFEP